MRILLIGILSFILSSAVFGQSLLAKRAFDEGARFAHAGDSHTALKAYRRALTASAGEEREFGVKLRYNLGVCLYRTGQLKAAKAELSSAIRLSDGRHQRSLYALGMTESALENWPAARAAFLASLALAPHDGEAWFDLAIVYLAEHDHEKAAAAFRKSIENKSVDSALGQNNLGVIMAVKREFEAAEKAFDAALTLSNGELTEARMNLELCRRQAALGKKLIAAELMLARRRSTGGSPA